MNYHRGGEPERAMHCWFNVMAHKPWITAEFVDHGLLFHERGKQNLHGLTWSKLNYNAWCVLSVSSLPLSVMVRSCHACLNLSRLLSFTPTLRSGSRLSPSPTWQQTENIACTSLHEILKCAHLWPQTDRHTYTQLPQMQSGKCWACSGSPQSICTPFLVSFHIIGINYQLKGLIKVIINCKWLRFIRHKVNY